jgi:hypothetical protein
LQDLGKERAGRKDENRVHWGAWGNPHSIKLNLSSFHSITDKCTFVTINKYTGHQLMYQKSLSQKRQEN